MQPLILHRTFLKKPQNGLAFLLIIVPLAWILILALKPDLRTFLSNHLSFGYLVRLVLGAILPEIITLFILVGLINGYHQIMKIEKINMTPIGLIGYQFKFMPLFLVAFFFFFPFTLHLRFLLREFPVYTAERYYKIYLFNGFSVNTYTLYLPFVSILGFVLVNISMLFDLTQKPNHSPVVTTPIATVKNKPKAVEPDVAIAEQQVSVVAKLYLTVIEVMTVNGTVFLPVQDCYYFMLIDDHSYAVEHSDGRFKIIKSITALNSELDPLHFFRCNRKCIINLNHTAGFVHLHKGRYNLAMKSPILAEFEISSARMELFKTALKNNIADTIKKQA